MAHGGYERLPDYDDDYLLFSTMMIMAMPTKQALLFQTEHPLRLLANTKLVPKKK